MAAKIFITGIGTGVGKTLVSAIVAKALGADYWKPVQAGFADGTDSDWIRSQLSGGSHTVYPEKYRLRLPASPHIAAREEGMSIEISSILSSIPATANTLVIEGAGGILVPLNEKETVADLISALEATVIIVSRNYLGSINHSLMTANICRAYGYNIGGWIFNDQFMSYENEISKWSGIPSLGSIPFSSSTSDAFTNEQASRLAPALRNLL